MMGWPSASYHVELVHIVEQEALLTPIEEDLIVLYLDEQIHQ